ncbi:hydroxysteroid dehydrogenase-like protein 2 [Asbolus verrucosus]|uniref:Hydroxysteroid dehydrogenase-like protein 2 n=1 Tax=Asbolus verrucosus TaxID=1661398 RepID=A0A482V6C8_ASBVE|nr:hydroxysteroid dehydrogenase-like protein 2 [Asbolus verrucosus]
MINSGKLAGRTVFITGGSRGIGKAIALKVARDGANVVIAAKTAEPHPKLPGTIYTACEEVEKAGGKGLPCIVDVRDEQQVRKAVEEAVKKFGGIDIVVNNASAISLTSTPATDMKKYDLMQNINTRGTFLVSKECFPYLQKSSHAHILNLSPPLNMVPHWFKNHVAYTMAKYGMSMCVLGMADEFKTYNIGVNALWPRTAIYTAAIEMLSGSESAKYTRKPEIMADAAYAILTQDPKTTTGNFFIDDEVLKQNGVTDFDQYAIDPSNRDNLMLDFFLDADPIEPSASGPSLAHASEGNVQRISRSNDITDFSDFQAPADGKIPQVFRAIEANLSAETVQKTQAVFQFVVTGNEAGKWFVDLKNGKGSCGPGEAPSSPDATLTMDSKNFFDMFSGKVKPATAFMTGKLKISGNMQKAMKLDKLMSSLKSKL